MCVRHRPSHKENTAYTSETHYETVNTAHLTQITAKVHQTQRKNTASEHQTKRTQHLNLRPREHSKCVCETQTDSTARIHQRQKTQHMYVKHEQKTNTMQRDGWMDGSVRQWMNGWKTEIKTKQNKTKKQASKRPAGSSLLQEDQIRRWLQSCRVAGSFHN